MTTITETNGLDFGVCVQNPLSFLLLKFQQENCHIVGFCVLKHLNPLVWMMLIYTDILLSYIRFTQSHMGSCLTCQQYLPGYSRWANSAKAWIPWACHRTEKPAPLWTSLFHLCYPLSNPPFKGYACLQSKRDLEISGKKTCVTDREERDWVAYLLLEEARSPQRWQHQSPGHLGRMML